MVQHNWSSLTLLNSLIGVVLPNLKMNHKNVETKDVPKRKYQKGSGRVIGQVTPQDLLFQSDYQRIVNFGIGELVLSTERVSSCWKCNYRSSKIRSFSNFSVINGSVSFSSISRIISPFKIPRNTQFQ